MLAEGSLRPHGRLGGRGWVKISYGYGSKKALQTTGGGRYFSFYQ